jgi:hypothetical protein
MLANVEYPKSHEYRTGSKDEPVTFFMESLMESNKLDLLLGYFSSSAIRVLSLGFAKFIANGGRMRMVINHILSEQDKGAILKGTQSLDNEHSLLMGDFNRLKDSLDSYGEHF